MKVPFNTLDRQFYLYQEEYEKKALEILRKGWYVLGPEVKSFEEEFAKYLNIPTTIGVDNGLNAIVMTVRALGIKEGDEVIVQANTYIASVMGITMNGATPIFVEPDEYYNIDIDKIEEKITDKTKAILVVHLYGQASNMEKILELCEKYNIKLIEDCAQAHGAKYMNKMVGTFGIGCFSFYPSKNLGCFGDGGAISTGDEKLEGDFRVLRNYGSEKRYYNEVVGYNSRLDELQAGLLRVKLSHIFELEEERKQIAERYLKEIKNPLITLPRVRENCTHVWHLFVVRVNSRDKFQKYLEKNGIGSVIHYPIPPHLSEAYRYLGHKKGDFPITEKYAETVLSLPLYNGMTKEELDYVIEKINSYEG
ncbi:UDP-4-amino-4-deoxy-L-arabinose--oxoglutarate aminotransferase [Fusobacterium necrogenes]|uniref:UDP-4-amino-4-deoxy-L-arabinose--oxoglutarate aminotransferase n=1 Tax=Fusobacterium necrogenes TaxID=858 RepID=A0A377GX71_9FUSO|nr:DegT/DnrJ/EryC1/StrS family aminotransferase [Fusobacterium necrogenes]STO31151.1 UDP-4-amino-4-deoxy-L-arabinose--oxoglutarate aminotransferase [Fusobacterium necrogenes]